jgi:hypothetical protein
VLVACPGSTLGIREVVRWCHSLLIFPLNLFHFRCQVLLGNFMRFSLLTRDFWRGMCFAPVGLMVDVVSE